MILEKYTSDWPISFSAIKSEIDKSLAGLLYTVEHVGSTAVPNLDSKPIIDIDIIHETLADFAKIKERLECIGYYHNGNQGIEGREVFKRDGRLFNGVLDSTPHHLYVCISNSASLERHLLSRDFLRKHEWARLKYQALKYEIAERSNQDRKVYARLKEELVNGFIDSIVEEEKRTRHTDML